ncbi:MAG: oxygen-independent coproporphyrinogen III oxidase [Deltaproteobacteria bacterium]|nr:oxygen-independent coproporphyrinogen III oxidase [Deltaproteobacteria bacterium]
MLTTFELLQKYDVPGPRYTSYPTVPIWRPSVGAADYISSINKAVGAHPLSLYFHIPFCKKLCHFCGCMHVITKDHSRSRPYVDALLIEMDHIIKALKNSNRDCSQIHFGGGTPNFLPPEEISRIMQRVRDNFNILPSAEIAIEMHPREDPDMQRFCDTLKTEGFNRISLGVQDFNDEIQKLINRFQSFATTKGMIDYLKKIGLEHFNFDLIYGLPGQNSIDQFKDTLAKTIFLKPNRIACYSYAHVPWVHPVQRSFKDTDIPTPEQKLRLFETAINFFTTHGYHLIGIDHFADEGDELYAALKNKSIHRNFMGYSTRADAHQIGLGVSSISFVGGHYFQNHKTIEAYTTAVIQRGLATHRGFMLSADDTIRRSLITEIMCHREVDFKEFGARQNIDFHSYFKDDLKLLTGFVDDGLITLDADGLKITPRGYLVVRNIAMCFDKYLDEIKKNARNPVFSRTV